MSKRKCRKLFLAALVMFCSCAVASGAYKDDIGYTKLADELGGGVPTGAGIGVSQVEAPEGEGDYTPYASDAQFTGKTITLMSGASGTSSHATTVGKYFYGNTTSVAPGVTAIDSWEANDWLQSGFLWAITSVEPEEETRRVQNHSWIHPGFGGTTDQDVLRRFDYTINRDNYVAVVGVNNGDSTSVPRILSNSYNAISVGRWDGKHSHGFTSIDVAGRIKPDIVVPLTATSWATPVVGAAAALLLETVDDNTPILDNAGHSETIKALLMAGATKDEFAGWGRTTTRPLDDVYGAGELNIYNSYHILVAGEQEASTSGLVESTGWDFDETPALSEKLYYFFELQDDLSNVSAILTWNRQITDGKPGPNWGDPLAFVADLDLRLYSADGFTLDALVDASLSTVDNVEHIYQTYLASGRYALEISSDTAGTEFAMAWYGVMIPEPSTLLLCAGGLIAVLRRRRRRTAA